MMHFQESVTEKKRERWGRTEPGRVRETERDSERERYGDRERETDKRIWRQKIGRAHV